MNIRIADYINESIVDGPGIRLTVFLQGCPHCCAGCHNPKTHDFLGGKLLLVDELIETISKNHLRSGLTISGGEPFEQVKSLRYFIEKYHEKFPRETIIIYSGYTYEQLIEQHDSDIIEILYLADILIDGPYIQKYRNLELKFRGSSNQRVIDLKKTIPSGIVLIDW